MNIIGSPNVERMMSQKDVLGLIKTLGYKKDAKIQNAANRMQNRWLSRNQRFLI
jgi:hypothetical protein